MRILKSCKSAASMLAPCQADLGVQLGSMPLMAKGQPLAFDKVAANQYLKVGQALYDRVG